MRRESDIYILEVRRDTSDQGRGRDAPTGFGDCPAQLFIC